jgi:putative transposase
LRERAIRMTLDARSDPASRPGACARIGAQLGINADTLRGWVTQAEVDAGGRPGDDNHRRREAGTERLAEAGAVASVGSKGDSYDNAMDEAFNSLFKAELVRNRGPWKSIDDLEIAAAEYIDWFNFRRLHGEIGLVPPVEYETTYRSTTLPEQPAQREFEVSIKPGT